MVFNRGQSGETFQRRCPESALERGEEGWSVLCILRERVLQAVVFVEQETVSMAGGEVRQVDGGR